eukprot:1156215-Pelagomonas_calceolata.AAC.3
MGQARSTPFARQIVDLHHPVCNLNLTWHAYAASLIHDMNMCKEWLLVSCTRSGTCLLCRLQACYCVPLTAVLLAGMLLRRARSRRSKAFAKDA